MRTRVLLYAGLAAYLLISLSACGGGNRAEPWTDRDFEPGTVDGTGQDAQWPLALPEDQVLPWEELDSAGRVVPKRSVLSISQDSTFVRGADFDSVAGDTNALGQGLNIKSGSLGSKALGYAIYRIPFGADEPGVLALDVNLHGVNGGSGISSYWLGLADYSKDTWQWRGPFTDGQVRCSTALGMAAGADYSSGLGNLFVALVAFDGAEFDVVGVGAESLSPADTTAPPAPAALGLTPSAGGMLLEWTASAAGDLAGYRVYYSDSSFASPASAGVEVVDYLEANLSHLLAVPAGGTLFCAVSAVDYSGNESAITAVESAVAGGGSAPNLIVLTDTLVGKLNSSAVLTASGADAYDFDLDGDGIYEILGTASGTQNVDTSQTGIIRPAVRGHDSGGAVAQGSVSLLISAGFAPVALLNSDVDSGTLWDEYADVNFDASASSDVDTPFGSLTFSFDPEGDGTFNAYSSNPLRAKTYTTGGVKLAAVKVKDPDGYEDVAYKSIRVYQVGGFETRFLELKNGTGHYVSLAEVNGRPAVAYFAPNGGYLMYCRAKDARGELWNKPVQIDDNVSMFCTLAVIKGNPAIVYWKNAGGELKYVRCADASGDTLAAWSNPSIVLISPVALMDKPVLIECNGNPAVLYGEGGALKYRRATTANGTGNVLGDWANPAITVVPAGAGNFYGLALINGNPALTYHDGGSQAFILRAITATGASALDWPAASVKVSGADMVGGWPRLVEANGAPAVAWYDSGINGVKYTRANTPDGAALGDWPVAVTVAPGPGAGTYLSMAIINGRPAVVYEDNSMGPAQKRYIRANDASGSAWGIQTLVGDNPSDGASQWCSLADINGLPGVAYHYQNTDCIAYALPRLSL